MERQPEPGRRPAVEGLCGFEPRFTGVPAAIAADVHVGLVQLEEFGGDETQKSPIVVEQRGMVIRCGADHAEESRAVSLASCQRRSVNLTVRRLYRGCQVPDLLGGEIELARPENVPPGQCVLRLIGTWLLASG